MKERLMEVLRCPKCHHDLKLIVTEYHKGEIKTGSLECTGCGSTYPITNFIPRFVPGDKYATSFSVEWTKHAKTQHDQTSGTANSLEMFHLKTGLAQEALKGAFVLDAGCGSGRFLDVAQRLGAEVVGLDLSYAVDGALSSLGLDSNIHLVQGDIFSLPFKRECFDFIYSIGALHHTPNTRQAFKSLLPYLRAGKGISIWVYPEEGFFNVLMNTIGGIERRFGHLVSIAALYHICVALRTRIPTPKFLLEPPTYSPSRTFSSGHHHPRQLIYLFFPFWSLGPTLEWQILDTFDYLSPTYQFKHSYSEVIGWFREEGMTDVRRLPIPVTVSGRKMQS